jgi:hypothetical protein
MFSLALAPVATGTLAAVVALAGNVEPWPSGA